jgi:CYTH domain-containing protein
MIEIERKFVPDRVPTDRLPAAGTGMRQGYIAEERGVAVRIRITESSATLTIKGGGGLSRTEVEATVPHDEAEALWALTEGRRIEKTRYEVPLDDGGPHGLVAEIDVYAGPLDGLCTIEVEFESRDDADSFTPPEWFGRDVTGEERWSNAALARAGRPDR